MNNYANRRKRGQCASCTDQALPNEVRCENCKSLHREKLRANSSQINALRRERALQRSMDRERRLESLDMLLKAEVAELEKAFRMRVGELLEKNN